MNEDLLDRLADLDVPTPTPALDRIQRRAHSIRRARQGRRAGLVGLGAGALVLGGIMLPPGSAPRPVAQGHPVTSYLELQSARAADQGGPDCDSGFGLMIDPAQWSSDPAIEESASLLADPPYPLTELNALKTTMGCPPAMPSAVLYSTSPVRGVSVWADVKDPFAGVTDPIKALTVRGAAGQYRVVNDSRFVTWLEPDGSRWFAMGSGVDVDQFAAVLDGLTFDGTTLDPTTVPDGFTSAPLGTHPASNVTRRWMVKYGDDPETGVSGEGVAQVTPPREEVNLEVTTPGSVPPQVVASASTSGVQFVQVNGQLAVYAPTGDPAVSTGGRLTWQADGRSYMLWADHGLAESISLAEQVEHVSLDDARLIASTK